MAELAVWAAEHSSRQQRSAPRIYFAGGRVDSRSPPLDARIQVVYAVVAVRGVFAIKKIARRILEDGKQSWSRHRFAR